MNNQSSTVHLVYLRHGAVLHVLGCDDEEFGHMRPIGSFEPDWESVFSATQTVESLVLHAADCGEFAVASMSELRRASAFLFDELVPPIAKTWLRDARGTLLLSLPPQLLDVPWELLHTGEDFLCLRWGMGRLIQQERVRSVVSRPVSTQPTMLLIADPDGELHEAYHEGETLRRSLREVGKIEVSFRAADVDVSFVRRQFRDHDVVHFAGHVDRDGWRMADGHFGADQVARLAGGAAMPRLVVANGCSSVRAHSYNGSMLEALLSSGVEMVLGSQFDLPDRLGRSFGLAFYEGLQAGQSVGESVRLARESLAHEIGEGTVPWGAYILYGDPRQRVITIQDAAPEREHAARATRVAPVGAPLQSEVLRRSEVAHQSSALRGDALGPSMSEVRTIFVRRWSGADWAFVILITAAVAITALACVWVASGGHMPRFE